MRGYRWIPDMPYRIALEEVERCAEEAEDAESDDAGPENSFMPRSDCDAEQEGGDGRLARGDSGDE